VARKLKLWIDLVEVNGLEYARKIPGYHDEPLHGQRYNQRSIRLGRGYRAFYRFEKGVSSVCIYIEEVNKHVY
jgi:proteic killer suppression protein